MFLIFKAKKALTKLKQVFIEAFILNYFDLEYYIYLEMHIFGYITCEIFNLLTLKNLDQLYQITIFSQKKIFIEIWYKTYNSKSLTIIKALKT